MTAIGGLPHLRHPNFPQRAKYYPPSVQLALMPFSEHALRHFVFLERPEGFDDTDAPEFDIIGEDFDTPTGAEVVPVQQDFTTVGQLYRAIEQGLRILVARYGERGVFIGPPKAQVSGDFFRWSDLVVVTDLASAGRAIEMVVEQGEGARGAWEDAHYGRFLRTLRELRELTQRDPAFEPARPVLPAYVRAPSDVERCDLLSDQRTTAVSDLFNGSYGTLLEVLLRFFLHVRDSDAELRELADMAVGMMFSLIAPLGHLLTTLPVGPGAPGKVAGPTFEIYRRSYLLPHHDAAWTIIREKLGELADSCQRTAALFAAPAEAAARATLGEAEQQLRALAESLARQTIRP
jgi:hypothetical protein